MADFYIEVKNRREDLCKEHGAILIPSSPIETPMVQHKGYIIPLGYLRFQLLEAENVLDIKESENLKWYPLDWHNRVGWLKWRIRDLKIKKLIGDT